MKIDYFNLEKKINYKFKDKKLLIKSLTHKSYDKINNNEKIEFLGDRVLGLIIAKKLLEIYPGEKEGILDKKLQSQGRDQIRGLEKHQYKASISYGLRLMYPWPSIISYNS